MSLRDLLSPRKRKYRAALTMLLAKYTYDQLGEGDRRKVDASAKNMIERLRADPFEATTLMHRYRYGMIAAALHELSIAPAVPGEQWNPGVIPLTLTVRIDDPEFQRAREDARQYLADKGVKVVGT